MKSNDMVKEKEQYQEKFIYLFLFAPGCLANTENTQPP
jgi:hypothetical protein